MREQEKEQLDLHLMEAEDALDELKRAIDSVTQVVQDTDMEGKKKEKKRTVYSHFPPFNGV